MVLGGAYVTANNSQQATRAAQERANALKLVESQIEQLKGLTATNPGAVFSAASPFCIYEQTTILSASDTRCAQNVSGGTATGSQPPFKLSINRSGNDFTVKNSWQSTKGTTEQLQIVYRVYQ